MGVWLGGSVGGSWKLSTRFERRGGLKLAKMRTLNESLQGLIETGFFGTGVRSSVAV